MQLDKDNKDAINIRIAGIRARLGDRYDPHDLQGSPMSWLVGWDVQKVGDGKDYIVCEARGPQRSYNINQLEYAARQRRTFEEDIVFIQHAPWDIHWLIKTLEALIE